MKHFYRQCKFERKVTNPLTQTSTSQYTTSWVPEQFAKLNNFVDLWDSEEEQWVKSWKVIEVGTRQSEEYILDHERDYKTQRKASDI